MAQIQTAVFPITRTLDQGKIKEFWRNVGRGQLINVGTVQVAADISFLVVTYFDDVAPSVDRTTPRDGQSDVIPDTDIVINFSEDITVAVPGDIVIRRNAAVIVGYSLVVTGSTLVISGAIDSTASSYTVTIGSTAITDGSGNTLEADYTFQFSTINAVTGSSIVDLINDSTSTIDEERLETNSNLRRKIRNGFVREVENREFVLGASDSLSDVFFVDNTDDPGVGFVPATTTAVLELGQMRAVAASGLPTATLYSAALPLAGATGCLLETDYDGVMTFKIHRDGSTAGDVISPNVAFGFAPTASSVRFSALFSTTGTVLFDYALYLYP